MKLAADMGHSYSKFFDGSEPKMLPTVLGEPQMNLMGDANMEEIKTSEGHWFVGQTALDQSLTNITGNDERWAASPEYRALLLYGISEHLSPSTDSVVVDLILSLPIVDYKRNRPKLTNLLRKTHLVERPNRRKLMVAIRNVVWLPQGFAPAKPFMGENKNIVALDWGSRNINSAQFKGRKLIAGKTTSSETGANQVLQDIGQRIEERTRRELSNYEIVEAIQTKTVRSFGQPIDVADIITDRLGYYNRYYESFISKRWKNTSDIDNFICFGGGAILINGALREKYPQMIVLDDPQFVQVIEMYKYLKRKLG